ncbi:MAG: glycosyltransferase [Burkholderiaceae bacterium]
MKATAEAAGVVVVTPVFEDVEASGRLFLELSRQFGEGLFVVAVDDGSVHQPLTADVLSVAGVQGLVLRLRRNVGHQKAIAVGLSYVADQLPGARAVVVMDSDGEDVPETVHELLRALEDPAVDVAVAHRKSRVETLRFKAFYAVYKRFFKLLTGRPISFGNFMALKMPAVQRLVSMQELSIHVAGAVLASRLRTRRCPLDRGPRYAGRSKMNFVGLVLHGFKGMMVFAEDVLIRVGLACALLAGLAVVAGVLAILLKLSGFATPGWFSLAFGILVLIFLQSGGLALMSFMTLMITGVLRGSHPATPGSHLDLVADVLPSRLAPAAP